MLAEDEITIRMANEVLHLRPTLRAAMRLERRFGGFDKLIEAIACENLTAMAAVLRESATAPTHIPNLIEGFADMTLDKSITSLKQPLIEHVLRLAGHDGSEASHKKADPKAKRMTYAAHHERLFEIATGWLGWTPDVAYDATAAEILSAFRGKNEMLRACYGGTEAPVSEGPTPEQFNAKLSAFLSTIPKAEPKGKSA